MKAVILAAGMGLRIRKHHRLPKGLIEIDEKPLIMHAIEKLIHAGIEKILVITGYHSAYYDELAQKTGLFETRYNPYFQEYNNLYSLYCAQAWVDTDILLLESDLLFEQKAIDMLCAQQKNDIILVSDKTNAGDEVYVEAKNSCLTNMSKNISTLNASDILGEFIGINKLCVETFQFFMNFLENNKELLQTGNYEEDGLVELAKHIPLYCLRASVTWCEIDNLAHLERAKKLYQAMHDLNVVQSLESTQ